jgi:hypothetical protein
VIPELQWISWNDHLQIARMTQILSAARRRQIPADQGGPAAKAAWPYGAAKCGTKGTVVFSVMLLVPRFAALTRRAEPGALIGAHLRRLRNLRIAEVAAAPTPHILCEAGRTVKNTPNPKLTRLPYAGSSDAGTKPADMLPPTPGASPCQASK